MVANGNKFYKPHRFGHTMSKFILFYSQSELVIFRRTVLRNYINKGKWKINLTDPNRKKEPPKWLLKVRGERTLSGVKSPGRPFFSFTRWTLGSSLLLPVPNSWQATEQFCA